MTTPLGSFSNRTKKGPGHNWSGTSGGGHIGGAEADMLEEQSLTCWMSCQRRWTGSGGNGNSFSIFRLLGPEATARSSEERE